VKVTLHIAGPYESREVELADELTIGRTDLAKVVVDDTGLSRVNTTFFIDGDEVYAVDENSLNGTFVNGDRISGPPRLLANGDEIRIGSGTVIRVAISGGAFAPKPAYGAEPIEHRPAPTPDRSPTPAPGFETPAVRAASDSAGESQPNYVVWLAASAVVTLVLVLAGGGIGLYLATRDSGPPANKRIGGQQQIQAGAIIPVRVIDPLGGEDEDDLDDLIASWEVQEEELKAENVGDVTVAASDTADADLNVTAAFLAERQKKALEARSGETGIRPSGLNVPKELFGDGVIKQKAKLREMNTQGYKQPLDFAELAEKRIKAELIEMPMAGKSYYLDVGGSASENPFTMFSFQTGNQDIPAGSPKFQFLSQLAANFSGQKYDLNSGPDRRQMRMRLLRMFNKTAKPILLEVADAYFQKFGRPLRVTSLTRSMDYQIGLNANNPNSFKVRGEGSLPPHTSGCAFDLARKHMNAEEQNFVMQKLAEMEQKGKLDALIEYGVNACFHVFIYRDGIPPKM
jgi:hypothetical protein